MGISGLAMSLKDLKKREGLRMVEIYASATHVPQKQTKTVAFLCSAFV